ncbi:hypothetical protein C2845_PM08G15140 [Panicum miliaceum]|uniref:Uncharacterized protein n=1 Tax=Panicum miliaceum TaxID=4540 RepID=A0A3L6R5V1_PANMI|nr:hypothetical protein C2845_PM08G15140 [Panicum miliaceum]
MRAEEIASGLSSASPILCTTPASPVVLKVAAHRQGAGSCVAESVSRQLHPSSSCSPSTVKEPGVGNRVDAGRRSRKLARTKAVAPLFTFGGAAGFTVPPLGQ